jgi:Predicted phosphohydrolases
MKRRTFFKRSLQSVLGVGLLSGFYAWQIEPFMLVFETLNMPLLNMPKELVGKTVMQISDVHVGNRVDADYLIESFKKAQAYKPDIVVYTGDFVHYEDAAQLEQLKTVFKHCVTGSMATLGVLGNHDYGLDWNEEPVAKNIIAILKANNVSILRNETTAINGLQIVGIDDFWGTNFKPKKALESTSDNLPTICLCHNPDVCDLPVWVILKDGFCLVTPMAVR